MKEHLQEKTRFKGGLLKRIVILLALIGIIVAVRMTGATHYLEQEKLRAFIAGYGALAPVADECSLMCSKTR